jgi:hypothetical protein
MASTHKASCYCGAVEIEASGEPLEMGYCHCNNCRRYSGAPVAAFTLWKADQVKITKGQESLGRFKSSEISDRCYCTKCGGHVIVDHPSLGLTDIRPRIDNLPFKPGVHLNYDETVLPIKDGLPKLKDFPKEIGGSGELLPE